MDEFRVGEFEVLFVLGVVGVVVAKFSVRALVTLSLVKIEKLTSKTGTPSGGYVHEDLTSSALGSRLRWFKC